MESFFLNIQSDFFILHQQAILVWKGEGYYILLEALSKVEIWCESRWCVYLTDNYSYYDADSTTAYYQLYVQKYYFLLIG